MHVNRLGDLFCLLVLPAVVLTFRGCSSATGQKQASDATEQRKLEGAAMAVKGKIEKWLLSSEGPTDADYELMGLATAQGSADARKTLSEFRKGAKESDLKHLDMLSYGSISSSGAMHLSDDATNKWRRAVSTAQQSTLLPMVVLFRGHDRRDVDWDHLGVVALVDEDASKPDDVRVLALFTTPK